MEKYDYRKNMLTDIREYIDEHYSKEEILERLNDDRESLYEDLNKALWVADSVTGNASGSYYCSAWKAEEALCHNIGLLHEAMKEFGCEYADFKGAEWGDVTIRCYLLSECLSEVLDQLEDEFND